MTQESDLERSLNEMRIDQRLIEWCLKEFDFELAERVVAVIREPRLAPITASHLREAATRIVADELERGRHTGPYSGSTSGLYMRATYGHYNIIETVDLELIAVSAYGSRPKRTYMREASAYTGGGIIK